MGTWSGMKKMKKGSFLSIFLHADLVDMLLMSAGFLGSLGNGLSLPLVLFITSRSMNILGLSPNSDPHVFLHGVNQNVLSFLYMAGGSFIVGIIDGYCWTRSGARQATRMRAKYLKAVLRQEVGYFDLYDQNIFEVVSNVSNESLIIQDVISEKVPNFISNITRFIGSYMVAFLLMWRLALVIFPFGIIMTIPGLMCQRILMGLARKMSDEYNKAGLIAKQAISSIKTVYSFVGESKTMLEFSAALHGCMKLGLKQGLSKGIGIGSSGITFFVWSFITWYGSRLVMYHGAPGGTNLIGFGGPSLASALSNLKCLTEASSIGEQVMKVINRVPNIDSERMEGEILESISGEVEFKNVEFAYPSRPDTIILHNFNLKVPARTTVALVGASGSGKSTVISLLERFYDPLGGQILLDGISITKLQLKWLRSQMGLVSQEPALFALSIKENILFGKEDATMEEVIAAAKASNAHNFISQLPQGYETQVGEGGIQMSGGQKQRIAIARATIRAPRILLLDEATSAMDFESERIVQEALQEAIEGRTTIVVAHRLSTICNADAIAVVQNGRVVESGSHDELIGIEQGQYSSLVQLQQTAEPTEDHKALTSLSSSRITGTENWNSNSHRFSSMSSSNSVDLGSMSRNADTDEQDCPVLNHPFQRLLFLNLTEWIHASLGCVSALLYGTTQPLYAFIMGNMIPIYFSSDHDEIKTMTRAYALAFAALAVFSYVTNISQHYNFATIGEHLTKRIREKMLAKILTFEVGWFDRDENSSGVICSRLADDANVVRSLVGDRISLLAQTFSAVLLAYTMSLIIAWRLAIVIISIQLLGIAAFYIRKVLLRNMSGNSIKFRDQSSKLAAEAVSNIRTVTAFSFQSRILEMLDRSQHNTINSENVRQSWIAGIVLGASLGLMGVNLGLNFWYGGKLIYQGHITVAALLKTFFILIYIGFSIADATSMTTDLAKAATAARSVFSVLDRFTQIEPEDPEGYRPDLLMGQVELQDVHFAYPARPDLIIFEGFTLKIQAGKSTALVGHSGSGKSTIIALIERFYDPLKGTVVIDGRDVRTYHLRSLRKQIALVSQEPSLFAGTIRENIAYGATDDVDEAEIIDAARAANAHDFISVLKDGYDTWCGDRGVQLSGGQKQRIAIARAILKNPAILLLDEATSALDGKSEKVVQKALDRVMVGRTSVVVAHRLSTIQNCDQIAVLNKGILMEKGTHLSLMEKGLTGAYFSLVSLQWKPDTRTAR